MFWQELVRPKLNYEVSDEETGAKFSHIEDNHDPKRVTGKYVVHLPDGRIQTVNYVADDKGYRVKISYEGKAKYEDARYKRRSHRNKHKASNIKI